MVTLATQAYFLRLGRKQAEQGREGHPRSQLGTPCLGGGLHCLGKEPDFHWGQVEPGQAVQVSKMRPYSQSSGMMVESLMPQEWSAERAWDKSGASRATPMETEHGKLLGMGALGKQVPLCRTRSTPRVQGREQRKGS